MVTVEIEVRSEHQIREVEEIVGHDRLYRKGTDRSWFIDVQDREAADLLAMNLNALAPRAQVIGDK